MNSYLEVKLWEISDLRVLDLCQLLSMLFGERKVLIQSISEHGAHGYLLRVRAREAVARERWPRIKSYLAEHDYLDQCQAMVCGPTTGRTVFIWPTPGP